MEKNIPILQANQSEKDLIDLQNYDIQEKVGQIDKWKYYKIINISDKINYFAKSSSNFLDNFQRGAVIDFFREIDINSKIKYPTILNFVGYSLTNFKSKGKPVIITEYASNYTLKSLLYQIKENVDFIDWNDTKKLIVIYGIASGMSFLHSHNIIHCNLNLESIFLDQNFLPKITNFYCSKKSPQNDFIREYQIKGDINYQPPEVSTRLLYSKLSDVYSFSLIVYAILTNNEPFQKLNDTIEIKNHRPTFDVPIAKCYQDLIEKCWSQDPKKRPTFDEIVNELRTNSNFITETVNKQEYENYIKFIENAPKSFNTEDNKRKLDDILKGKKRTFSNSYIDDSFDFSNPFDLTKYHIKDLVKENNEYKTYDIERDEFITFNPFKTDICRKEVNFFFRNEIINLYHKLNILSQVKHPSIIYFCGYSPVDFNDAQKPVIVKGYHINILDVYNDFKGLKFTSKFVIIYGIAYGMAYLHSHDIIHCDLKLSNITIDVNDVPKIDGFDVSIDLKNDIKEKTKTIKGTPAYLAPEIYRNQEYSKASDVYSFGMILYEMMTGQKAFEQLNNPNEIKKALLNERKRPSIDYPINETYRELIERCWSDDPTLRPTFDEILHELQTNRGFISEDFDEEFFNEYIKYLENSKIEFNPNKRITCFDKIIATKLQTYPVLDSYSSLSSMYETEYNDLCLNYNYIDLNRFQFTKMNLIHCFFYDYKQVIDKETNEVFMMKFPNKSLKHFTKNDINIFSQELSIISQLDHPAILKFIGYNPIFQTNNKNKHKNVIVVEYSSKGSLDIFIKSKNNETINFDDTKKLIIIYGIVSGMSYLHSHNILHRDLKPENVYLDDLMHPKISGFNISIELQKNSIEKTKTIKGTPAYLAPEIYRNQEYSKASDVYSFGMILYEMMTGQKAFEQLNNPNEIKNALLNERKRPSIDYPINETYRELIERCWSDDPTSRPTFDEILHELQTNRGFINDSINEKEYQEYINFIKTSSASFNPSKKITQLDIIIKNKINEYGDNDYKINFRNIYSTEFNNVLFEYNFLNINEFEKLNLIGRKGYLKVYKVRNKKTNQIFIAYRFKIIMECYNKLYKNDNLFQEINKLIGLNYPSILKFIGYSPVDFKNEQIPMYLTENVVENSLYSFFYDENTNNIHLLDETKRLIILYGIASGMSYLHSLGIVHGNLDLVNINLDNFLYPKIIGLDKSSKVSENPIPNISKLSVSLNVNENPFYSPERLLFNAISTADDVYAFSMIAYYLVNDKQPFNVPTGDNFNFRDFEKEMERVCYEGFRPDFKDSVNECYKKLIEKCWSQEPKDRPTFDEIVYHLKTNPDFITESINKKEFQDYVDYLDKYETQKEYSQIDDFIKSNNYSFRKVSLNLIKLKKPKKVKFTIDMGSIDITNYNKLDNIGEGNFGVVYTVLDKKTNKVFAAKKSKYSIDECNNDVIINLVREINIISILNHPSIVRFIGYSPFEFKKLKKKPVIITEYVSNGSLAEMLQNEQRGFAPHDWNDTKKLINIYGIATGMKYLHSLNIIHRDLKPENIFLDESLYPKIGDFGLSKNIKELDVNNDNNNDEKIIKLSNFKGTPLYSSPEILTNNDYSKEGDVYAFGLIVYEIITRNSIIENCNFYEWRQKIIKGHRPKFDNDIPYCYKNLIKKCWSGQKSTRPSFDKILKMIESNPMFITKNIDENEYNDYISLINGKDYKSIKSNEKPEINEKQQEYLPPKQTQHQSNEPKIYEPEDILKDIYLDLSKYDIESVLYKCDLFKLYKLKEKQTNKECQGQISMNKIDRISDENHFVLSKKLNEISQFKHPSLLKFIGYSPFDFKMKRRSVIVTEFPSNGTLYDLFEILRINDDILEWNDTKKLMNIYGIASGMSYLHSHDIIHRSLNSSTIFLDEFFTPKIGDFGLSTLIPNSKSITNQSMSRMKNESVYLAPEVLLNEKYSKSSDVYSFGMIVYEIISNRIPFDDIENENQIIKIVSENHTHLKINDDVPKIYKNLIEKCLSYNQSDRPSFEEIVLHLKTEQEFITEKIIEKNYHKYINFIEDTLKVRL